MPISQTSLFQTLQQSLIRDQKKIEIISDNMARSHIPNAKTKVLKENSFEGMVRRNSVPGLKTTDPRHISAPSSASAFKVTTLKSKEGEMSITGNGINPQDELRKLNETYTKDLQTQAHYAAFVNQYKTILGN